MKARRILSLVFAACIGLLVIGSATTALEPAKHAKPKEAAATTKAANDKLLSLLPFASKQDMEDATRGFIAPLPNNGVITNEKGEPI